MALPARRDVRRRRSASERADFVRPMLGRGERLTFWVLCLLWFAAQTYFWIWWFRPEHWVTIPGMAILTAVLGLGVLYQVGAFVAGRAKVPREDNAPVAGRVAMVVTKAPAEPWDVVRHTLECMLDQDYGRPFDVWLADEQVSSEVAEWCRANNVMISTREDVAHYHRPTWPRRTRCKEGNLAHFYDHFGYALYDFVCQFDADHAPRPDYLAEIMRSFADPGVGYVAAPSLNTRGVERSAAGRGRVFKESPFHGAFQAGKSVASCIGSHYAVRTVALKQIGGLGPELAEDYSTTLAMNANGWRGGFAIDAIAEGDAPETFADTMTQEMQWARSLISVLYGESRRLVRRAPLGVRLDLRWSGSFYAVLALSMLAGTSLPIIALAIDIPWISLPILDFLVRAALPTLLLLILMTWSRGRGLSRPIWGRVVGWETFVYEFTRWPWVAVGVAKGFMGVLLRRPQRDFRLTPKAAGAGRDFPLIALFPYVLLTWIGLAAIGVFATTAADARGYLLLAWLNAATAALSAVIVLSVHMVEHPLLARERHFPHFLFAWGSLGAVLAVGLAGAYALNGKLVARAVMSDGLWTSTPAVLVYVLLVTLVGLTWWANRAQYHLVAADGAVPLELDDGARHEWLPDEVPGLGPSTRNPELST